ncbi:hypothetical protein A1704_17900 [Chryseobacterium cucumeris]|uniref:hypothetical protein n=1 Tax=Chryseobacterium cucumeris TaxID=1813611 RepID=UPI000786D22D|nr:hypothetical protein [Chryseobacterium cucumeris]KYH04553.1 hypothetical protein A1704_17900 [Chryseobacterium cucumeris]
MTLLNVIWPAIYVSEEVQKFWYLIFLTIIIETITIYVFLKIGWKKSVLISIIGNLISGFLGTLVMMFAMLIWHFAIDRFLPNATFDKFNWISTYFLMCLGSVCIETFAISKIFKFSFKKLFIPLLIGNALSYSFIVFAATKENDVKQAKQKRIENVFYKPLKNNYTLLNKKDVMFYTAKIEIEYDENNKISNISYPLEIIFKYDYRDYFIDFPFELRLSTDENSSEIGNGRKIIYLDKLSDTVKVVLEQKNPDENIGWTKPIITDTLKFVRSKTE